MKICFLGDTHFGCRGDSLVFHKFFEKFYSEVFFPYMREHNIKHLVQLGDIFDKKKSIDFLTLSRSRDYFFNQLGDIQTTIMVGNHDSYFKNNLSVNSPRLLLNEYSNIQVIDSPQEMVIGDANFLVLPWICKENEDEVNDLILKSKSPYALGHLELAGFCMSKGSPSKHGMDSKIFDKFELVMTGHYHHRSKTGNIHYLGTPYEITWADYADPRGFHILDTDTRELTFVENPFILHHKIPYDDDGKTIEELLDFDTDKVSGGYVQLVVVNKTNQYHLDMFVSHLESAAYDVKINENSLAMEFDNESIEDVEDTPVILKNAIDEIDTNVPKEMLSDFMLALYHEACQVEVA